MSEFSYVHPWTARWWGMLPTAYRDLDAQQFSPESSYAVGLNIDPTFGRGFGSWAVTPVMQDGDVVAVSFQDVFKNLALGQRLHFQIWWDSAMPGAIVSLNIFDRSGQSVASLVDIEATEGGYAAIGVDISVVTGNIFTVEFVVAGDVTGGGDEPFITVRGVNTGYTAVTFEQLPVPGAEFAFPLLRYMDGAGRIAGEIRDLSDSLWDGEFTNPATVPDYAIRWLAQMMGVPATQRELPVETLRTYLLDLVAQGRPAAGNRQSIVLAAKRFLTGDRQTIVQPSPTVPHTIMVLVRADEVPGFNVQPIVDGIRAAGVIPAGHDLQVVLANATWDAWEAAAGTTWTELEALAPTWAKADSLGIQLE